MKNTIFFSYRRADGGWAADLLYSRLGSVLGNDTIFRDIDGIAGGDEWKEVLSTALQGCTVFLAVIGPKWMGERSDGRLPRIFDERDYVRAEIEIALARKIRTIPILLDPGKLPPKESLPPSISALTSRQKISIYPGQDFELGFQKLIQTILSELPEDHLKLIEKRRKTLQSPPINNRRFGFFLTWIAINIFILAGFVFLAPRFNAQENSKISYVRRGNDFLPQITDLMASSKDTVWFFGTNFHITATDRREDIMAALERGVHVRFLVLDPDSSEAVFEQMSRDFSQNKESIRHECKGGISSLLEIKNAWTKRQSRTASTATFEVRTYIHYPWARVYCFDPKSPSGTTFMIPYMNAANSSELPGFVFDHSSGGAADRYFSAIVKIWNDEGTRSLK